MTQSTNPLDRIRSLAPADMTDDELGVAIEEVRCAALAVEWPKNSNLVPEMQIASIKSVGHWRVARVQGDFVEWDNRSPNPAKSYDALLPIVREWIGKRLDRTRAIHEHIKEVDDGHFVDYDASTWIDEQDVAVYAMIHTSPRQLAEAFVTAAREVG